MKRKIIGLAKESNAVFIGATPTSTHSVGPSSDVTGMATGSVIHQMATKAMTANSRCCSGVRLSMGVTHINNAHNGPIMAPKMWRLRSKDASCFIVSVIFISFFAANLNKKFGLTTHQPEFLSFYLFTSLPFYFFSYSFFAKASYFYAF